MTVVTTPPIPAGVMHQYAGASAPAGYLLCDGSTVSRTIYASLFAVLSTTYGAGDGSTTFHLPDLRGRVPMGAGTGTGLNASGTGAPSGTAQTARTRGQWGGEETHLNLAAESGVPAHNHTATDSGHTHTYAVADWTTAGAAGGAVGVFSAAKYYTGNTGTSAANITVANSTAANASSRHSTVPPFVVTNYIIKT